MTALAHARPTNWGRFEKFWDAVVSWRYGASAVEDQQEETRVSRDLILEVLGRNPDAFRSELDIQNMAHLYRCRF